MVNLYDKTRVFDQGRFSAALDFLVDKFPPDRYNNVFYPGIGTGRIAIPFSEKGYSITGIDISEKMLAVLEERLQQTGGSLPITLRKADVEKLPFPDNSFDIAIAVHLFYFIPQWKRAVGEILRVLRENSPFILMHTGGGMEIPFINQRYKDLCVEQGFPIPDIGVESNGEVTEYCQSLGYITEWIRDRWQWAQRIQLGKALDYMKARAYSFTTLAPDDIHAKALETLESELITRYGDMDTGLDIPNQIYIVIILPAI